MPDRDRFHPLWKEGISQPFKCHTCKAEFDQDELNNIKGYEYCCQCAYNIRAVDFLLSIDQIMRDNSEARRRAESALDRHDYMPCLIFIRDLKLTMNPMHWIGLKAKEIIELLDDVESSDLSECCGAPIVEGDICLNCKEHC